MPSLYDARDSYGSTLAFVPERGELPLVLNARGLFGCGVEVGVKQGEFSEHLLRHWQGAHLISVDPWLEDAADAYVDVANVPQALHESFFQETVARLAPFGARSSIWRLTSLEASERIPRHALDFVYLDARHDYDAVLADLSAWFERVRPGGILAGHDYLDGHFPAGVFGVKSAVDAFFAERGLPVYATRHDEPWVSWMVYVPTPPELAAVERALAEAGADSAAAPAPAAAPPVPAAARSEVTLSFNANERAHAVKLRLDRAQMSQRLMLDAFTADRMYEPETSQFVASVLREGDTFVDVGAHVGYFSMLAATLVGPGGRVLSFEPEAENFRHLQEHARLNGFAQVQAINQAVGDAEGTAEFFVNADNDGGHALWDVGLHGFNRKSRLAPQRRQVRVTTLDRVLADEPVPPRLIKIDAEGCEQRVLQGARGLLQRTPVPFVVCEVNHFGLECMGASEASLRQWMLDLGYDVFALHPRDGSLVPLRPDQRVVSEQVFNLLFRHRSAAPPGA